MKKTAIFYGSSTGNTEAAANILAEKLDADIYDVADNPEDKLNNYDNLVFGTSTWGFGDLQDDWEEFIEVVKNATFSNKTIAIFGFGDGDSYPDTFVDGIGIIYKALDGKNCKFIGFTNTDSYEYDESIAEIDGKFIGLPLDEENQSDLSAKRLNNWVEQLKPELK